IPAPGYTFVYWLGSVDSPSAYETSIRVDGPKIVIAVFERSEFGLLIEDGLISGSASGGMMSVPSPIRMGRGARPSRGAFPPPVPPVPPPPEVNDFPVPGPNDQEPIPEPATAVLMAAGTISMMRRNRRRRAILK
ncbi:MAG: PEP-CTERM sorting domain-containing protein, partial [Planctomycetes bacterium]|nr:PEP-CTERM sorting domain-containing protein [Planctomycetota bacterium]